MPPVWKCLKLGQSFLQVAYFQQSFLQVAYFQRADVAAVAPLRCGIMIIFVSVRSMYYYMFIDY